MFWAETIYDKSEFCVCGGVWKKLKIISVVVSSDILKVYCTPVNGNMSMIFSLRKGENFLSHINFDLNFSQFQHVKFEVIGGEIVILGECYDGTSAYRIMNSFPSNCPFATEEYWGPVEKIIKSREEDRKLLGETENKSLIPIDNTNVLQVKVGNVKLKKPNVHK